MVNEIARITVDKDKLLSFLFKKSLEIYLTVETIRGKENIIISACDQDINEELYQSDDEYKIGYLYWNGEQEYLDDPTAPVFEYIKRRGKIKAILFCDIYRKFNIDEKKYFKTYEYRVYSNAVIEDDFPF